MRPISRFLISAAIAAGVLLTGAAFAGDAQGFLHEQHGKLESVLRQPASSSRDGQVSSLLGAMVDFDELTRRSFGAPCPTGLTGCKDLWAGLSESQRTQVSGLVRQLVEKNYKKNLVKTLDYDITYKGAKDQGDDSKIFTEAKSKLKPRDPAVRVDYIVRGKEGAYRVVDIVTEGASMTKGYYDQFKKMLETADQGFPYIVTKLQNKINKPD